MSAGDNPSATADPYAALGLKRGADSADVERAFRALIKEHHPDRAGGDAGRAAELNWAYRELKDRVKKRGDVEVRPPLAQQRRGSPLRWFLALAVIVALAILAGQRLAPVAERGGAGAVAATIADTVSRGVTRPKDDIMDQPLAIGAIDSAVLDAIRLDALGDDLRMADETRDCHRDLRLEADIARFDRCIAFDNAVIVLKRLDPEDQSGMFGQGAVTGRAWTSAQTLSRDYFATDSRLKQIRVRVELMLASQGAAGAGET